MNPMGRRVIGDLERGLGVMIEPRAALPTEREQLTAAEQEALAAAGFGQARTRQWIAGRVATHRALAAWLGADGHGLSVINDASGAPRVVGREGLGISLSHEDAAVAVALTAEAGRRAAVDLCRQARSARVASILERLGVPVNGQHPCVIWAALECTVKLHHRSVWSLLDARPRVREFGDTMNVRLACGEATVNVALTPPYAIAWGLQ
jgi:hypothetical protein